MNAKQTPYKRKGHTKTWRNRNSNSQQINYRNNSQHKKNKFKRASNDTTKSSIDIHLNPGLSFEVQVETIISQIKMTKFEEENAQRVCEDIHTVFKDVLVGVEPTIFGSVLAGTAFRNSDVDVYLKCYGNQPNKTDMEEPSKLLHRTKLFYKVIKILNARIPIIKAVNSRTKMCCDISFTSPHGMYNSVLIKYLYSYDFRVYKTIMIVLLWAKFHNIVGPTMSSFTVILLVIFYLQSVQILPPLYKVIINTEGDEWPTAFNDDKTFLHNTNKESLDSILLGFFTYYSRINFDEVVISPFAGQLILKIFFENPDLLPDYFNHYRRLISTNKHPPLKTGICTVQEPLILCLNTTLQINEKAIHKFKSSCSHVCDIFNAMPVNECLKVMLSGVYGEDMYKWTMACPKDITSDLWKNKVVEAVKNVFSKILLMEVSNYSRSRNEFANLILEERENSNPTILWVSCKYSVCSKGRSSMLKIVKNCQGSDFDKETKASRLFIEDIKNKNPINFSAIVSISTHMKNGSAEISMIADPKNKNSFNNIVNYLRNENFKHFMSLAFLEKGINREKQIPIIEKASNSNVPKVKSDLQMPSKPLLVSDIETPSTSKDT